MRSLWQSGRWKQNGSVTILSSSSTVKQQRAHMNSTSLTREFRPILNPTANKLSRIEHKTQLPALEKGNGKMSLQFSTLQYLWKYLLKLVCLFRQMIFSIYLYHFVNFYFYFVYVESALLNSLVGRCVDCLFYWYMSMCLVHDGCWMCVKFDSIGCY